MKVAQARAPGLRGIEPPEFDFSRFESLKSGIRMPEIPPSLLDRYRRSATAVGAKGNSRNDPANIAQTLVQRVTMGWTLFEQQRIEEIGARAYLEEQLHPETIDDGGLEDAILEALPSIAMTPGELLLTYGDQIEVPAIELLIATVIRAVYSPRQLLERMAVFWTDHFNIFLFNIPNLLLKPTDDRQVIRRHALGRFPDLLRASAHSPAMLDYLTNNSNVREHPNENYSRELMELHTLGVEGGYTELDVKEVARCFTGWTYWSYPAGPAFGSFVFNPAQHDFETKTVLGQTISAARGIEDGEAVLDILATHESTARFISTKLLRYLWGYEPEPSTVDKVAQTYLTSGGDIRSMLWTIFRGGGFHLATPKLKRPYHLFVSTVRALFAELRNPGFVLRMSEIAGHFPYNWPAPNGYPDSAGYWSGFLLPRWNFAALAVTAEDAGIAIDLPFLDPSTPIEELVAILDQLLLNGAMTAATRAAVRTFLESSNVNPLRIREAIGLVLASPEFQSY